MSFEQSFILYKILTDPRGMFKTKKNIVIDKKTAESDNQKGWKSTIHYYIILFLLFPTLTTAMPCYCIGIVDTDTGTATGGGERMRTTYEFLKLS